MGERDEPTKGAAAANGPRDASGDDIVDTTAEASAIAGEADEGAAADSPEGVEQRIASLEAELHERREEVLRERAEVENFKRRMLREKTDALRFALEPLVRDLLPVVDNLERALDHAEAASVVEGVKLVHKGLIEALVRNGVERVDAVGKPFDPNVHEAIAQADSADVAPGAVVAQHQPGYKLHERLVRPAMVTVNARKAASPVESEQDSD